MNFKYKQTMKSNNIKYGKEKQSLLRHRNKEISEYGLHTPLLTQYITKTILTKTGIKFMDNSYGNDCTDSLWDELDGAIIISIYIPNSTITDYEQELFSFFTIQLGEESDMVLQTEDLSEVITYINNNIKTLYNLK